MNQLSNQQLEATANSDLFLAYKNQDLEIIECSKSFLNYSGFKNKAQIIGKTDINCAWGDRADIYRRQEEDALAGECYSVLQLATVASGDTILLFTNKSLITNENSDMVSISVMCLEVHNKLYHDFISNDPLKNFNKGKDYSLKPPSEIRITDKEGTVLFYLLRGKSAKMIAQILKNSPRTIEIHINNLKNKFNCSTKAELIGKAFDLGYSGYIPKL